MNFFRSLFLISLAMLLSRVSQAANPSFEKKVVQWTQATFKAKCALQTEPLADPDDPSSVEQLYYCGTGIRLSFKTAQKVEGSYLKYIRLRVEQNRKVTPKTPEELRYQLLDWYAADKFECSQGVAAADGRELTYLCERKRTRETMRYIREVLPDIGMTIEVYFVPAK